jgi:hypothetical protein
MDPAFGEKAFRETQRGCLLPAAGGGRAGTLLAVSGLLTDEMRATLQADADALKAKGGSTASRTSPCATSRSPRRGGSRGKDYVTVLFQANLLDYTTDRREGPSPGAIPSPSSSRFWTFTRPVGRGVATLRDPAGGVAVRDEGKDGISSGIGR